VNLAVESILGKALVREAAANTVAGEPLRVELDWEGVDFAGADVAAAWPPLLALPLLVALLLPQPAARTKVPSSSAAVALRRPRVSLTGTLLWVDDMIRAHY
jgi:hypothetical protein